ncbi:Signal sequence receptor subunit gamma [Aphelenchoides besseyi]|nr:Signal sequence receptor subunit gamma [Aphelenchoides besseyi]KAI6194891.1 Signal sequence receptor subunit gamma [Aphelenchoides besseyi]
MVNKAKFSKEDELLLQDFSASISKTASATFYLISLVAAAAPIYLYYGVHQMEINDSWFIWIAAVVGVTYILAQAYKNVKHVIKHQIVVKRGDAVTREISRQLADDKNMSKKEKDERVLWKKNEVGDYEATVFTIFYNNIFFYTVFLALSFFLLANVNPIVNCFLSMYGAAGIVYGFSQSKKTY